MSTQINITIRDVPEAIRDELAARAALKGLRLEEYLRCELERIASRPSRDMLMSAIRARKRATGKRVPPEEILRARDTGRR